jgi:periplasmic protein TonB
MKSLISVKNNQQGKVTKDLSLGASLVASSIIHIAVMIAASILIGSRSNAFKTDLVAISLLDVPAIEKLNTLRKQKEPPVETKPTTTPKVEHAREPKAVPKRELPETVRPAPPPSKEEAAKSAAPVEPAPNAILSTASQTEGGGSEAGAGNLFGKGNVGIVPGTGTSGGGGGTAVSGLGRGAGAPGLPAQSAILKTNREAKPIQTVRAAYPPLALRMGMEGDVTIRIEVDTEGKVTRSEIMKGAGAGFDEEALKAVQQSRFEPAQKDGQNVPAEFTYVYRFRMAK